MLSATFAYVGIPFTLCDKNHVPSMFSLELLITVITPYNSKIRTISVQAGCHILGKLRQPAGFVIVVNQFIATRKSQVMVTGSF